jgi:hypothetical protein
MGAFFRDIPALESSDGSNLSINQNNVLPGLMQKNSRPH